MIAALTIAGILALAITLTVARIYRVYETARFFEPLRFSDLASEPVAPPRDAPSRGVPSAAPAIFDNRLF